MLFYAAVPTDMLQPLSRSVSIGTSPHKLFTRPTHLNMKTPTFRSDAISGPQKRPQAANAIIAMTCVLSGVGAMVSTAPMLILVSGAVLCLIILLLWRGDDPPILLLPALFQWSEVAIVPLSTIWLNVSLNELSSYGADISMSALYGLLGIGALSTGMWLGSGVIKGPPLSSRLAEEAKSLTLTHVLTMSMPLIGLGYGFAALASSAGSASQVVSLAANVKCVGLFILTYWCLFRGKGYAILLCVMAFEVIFGMTGFFAQFKDSILTFFVAALAARPKIRAGDVLIVGLAASLILGVAIFWSAIKPDYRNFMNQGTGAQVVNVPVSERIDFLSNAASTFDQAKFADGFERLVARHGYVEFLSLVMTNIPQSMSHENGKLTVAVFRHITMPRFLWPEKPALPSDTEVMSKYTGLPMVWNSDTSISIGYLGELYVDFGYWGGLLASGSIGFVVGIGFGLIRSEKKASSFVVAGFCLMLALPIAYFGTAYIKMAGSFIMTSAIVFVLVKFIAPIVYPIRKTALGRGEVMKSYPSPKRI